MESVQYTFKTPVRLTKGIKQQAGIPGTLSLTAAGRLDLMLDSGQLIFSTPTALTKRKYESTWGWLRIVVGPYVYRLQFFEPGPVRGGVSLHGLSGLSASMQSINQAKAGSKSFKAWQQHLEQAATINADNQPITVTNPDNLSQPITLPPGATPTGGFGLTAGKQTLLGLIIGVSIIVGIALLGTLLSK